ncbi:MAG: DUF58 domain-containing protein [Gammaproteobacteria bacterium]|nr:DUF58 domain-containing protein [Gammaproteobacteria bacterium]
MQDFSAVRIDSADLIALRRQAAALPLRAGSIRAQRAGQYRSAFKGRGMEFDEVRLYQPGDDVRSLDWRVTARTGKPHTKLFKEERERPVLFWVDLRAPMFFATRGVFKSVLASRAAALLAWSALAHGDQVGGLLFSEEVHHECRPSRGQRAVLALIRRLLDHPSWQQKQRESGAELSLQRPLSRLRQVAKPGSLIFLLSDFRGLDQAAQQHLANLATHNDLVLINLYDRLESQLPQAGVYRLSDGERELSLDSGDLALRESYQQHFTERTTLLEKMSARHGCSQLSLATDATLLSALQTGLGLAPRRL